MHFFTGDELCRESGEQCLRYPASRFQPTLTLKFDKLAHLAKSPSLPSSYISRKAAPFQIFYNESARYELR